ncbi:MAG TPA: helix-turn-helix domain-containing protein [Gemmatimonadaceae bacterium]|nr:helix-turn-helix domain-containing protein [Gemmatimonadaceae bacterium]
MSTPAAVSVMLLAAADARARVVQAAGREAEVRACQSPAEAIALLAAHRVDLLVIDALDERAQPTAPSIASIRRLHAALPILVYCAAGAESNSAMLEAVRCGATGVVFRGIDDVGHAMRAALRAARHGAVRQRIYDALAPGIGIEAQPILRYALSAHGDDVTVQDAAAALGVDRKTLFNVLRRRTDMPPREFINLVRLTLAIGLLEQSGRAAEHVALELGFASAAAFRNMLQRHTGLTATALRQPGGLGRMLSLLQARIGDRIGDEGAREGIALMRNVS